MLNLYLQYHFWLNNNLPDENWLSYFSTSFRISQLGFFIRLSFVKMQNAHSGWTTPSCTNPGACKVVKVFGFKCRNKRQENLMLIKHWVKQLLSLGNRIRALIVLPVCLMANMIDSSVRGRKVDWVVTAICKELCLQLWFYCWYLTAVAFTIELLVSTMGWN